MTTETANTELHPPLRRLPEEGMLAGVAAGIADRFGVDPTLVRIGVVLFSLMGGAGVPLYLAAWLLLPEAGAGGSIAEELLERFRVR